MRKPHYCLGVLSILCAALCASSACTATGSTGNEVAVVGKQADKKSGKKATKKKTDSDDSAKQDQVRRKLEIAEQKLAKARLAAEHGEAETESKITTAQQKLIVATTKLQQLEQYIAPNKLARAELGLQGSLDRFNESQEEMTQLELMYAEEDFAEKTKEIVLERGKRRLERSQRDLEIRRRELEFTQSHDLPLQIKEQQFKVEQAQKSLDKAKRDSVGGIIDRRIATLTADAAVAKLQAELEKLEKEAKEKKE